ncbi:hypothetical protein [Nonomuraea sp. NPDC049400]|uniref:hypothetical protein n=1 Tax=Nonomuraea sp. NPDC049400 TaxID=3364352 RepID=UPI003788D78C
MRTGRADGSVTRVSWSLLVSAMLLVALHPPAARAARTVPNRALARHAPSLSITVPTGTVNLGNVSKGNTISASLGTVNVTDSRNGIPPWTATVTATDFTTTATPTQTIPKSNAAYWSGPVSAQSGTGTRVPGQPTANDRVTLATSRTAFSGRKTAAQAQSTSWAPTIVITIPASAIAGTYRGTISHSAA